MPAWKVVEIQPKTAISPFFGSFSFCLRVFSLLFVNYFLSCFPGCYSSLWTDYHLGPAQAHERDDLEEGGAVSSLIKAASYLCSFDKTWNSRILPDHLINNQNPSTEQSVAGNFSAVCLARRIWGRLGRILWRRAPKPMRDCFIPGRGQGRFLGARLWRGNRNDAFEHSASKLSWMYHCRLWYFLLGNKKLLWQLPAVTRVELCYYWG